MAYCHKGILTGPAQELDFFSHDSFLGHIINKHCSP